MKKEKKELFMQQCEHQFRYEALYVVEVRHEQTMKNRSGFLPIMIHSDKRTKPDKEIESAEGRSVPG